MTTIEERFWSKADVRSEDECWLWKQKPGSAGYGLFWIDGGYLRAHCVAYVIRNGMIPDGKLVRHKCDVRVCVNPKHLEIGTHADNSRDMVERGRSLRGSRSPFTRLTDEMVELIRLAHAEDGVTTRALAKICGTSPSTIARITSGKTWKAWVKSASAAPALAANPSLFSENDSSNH